MVDVLTPKQRSFNMSQIRGKNTSPEMIVRRTLHSLGYRFRLHVRDLPGCPDIVLPKHRVLVFVHGCFWHVHRCRYGKVVPKTNADFWQTKRLGNVARDKRNTRKLRRLGWKVVTLWECETRNQDKLKKKLEARLRFAQGGASRVRSTQSAIGTFCITTMSASATDTLGKECREPIAH